ncbi:hypothetical protein CAPTEDRAFT_133364 [Capitella teleta]|uniref:Heat shock 70 kDa protein 12A n=1 Tax=Capitella teleta TaxID=283909 RepID=R7VL14_CAPTE|nr:hypothetical protein CAPTEDRAFT_133364 [Capitella teleta]|eukprot:ELU17210.1 hypothetical protein CAPTEDRAFT_133364 [Capitella teleta]
MASWYNDDDYEFSAALDIGTTFSGYAYSFKGRENDIAGCRNWGANLGVSNHKTPTAVLVNKDGKFEAFGYEAQEKYKRLEGNEVKMYSLFERFKMQLMDTEGLDRESVSFATDGKQLPLMEIFTMTFRYLKDRVLKSVEMSLGEPVDLDKIRWVITVPAIWSDAAKQFMREAAFKAGVRNINKPMQLIIALEPEVAGLYAASKDMAHFASTSRSSTLITGVHYIVMDCGGGTIDATAYKIESDQTLKQIYEASGKDLGGIKVDEAFVELLEEIVGKPVVDAFRQECPIGWLMLMSTFDHKKKTIQNQENESVNIEIPKTMYEIAKRIRGIELIDIINQSGIVGVRCNTLSLVISHNIIQRIFRNPVRGIIDHMSILLRKKALENVSVILMVGGFSESPILQVAVKEAFGNRVKVLIPGNVSLSVLYGAVAFGHNPNIVTTRIASKTYGEEICEAYDPIKHGRDKRRVKIIESVEHQTKVMRVFVTKGEAINRGQVKPFKANPHTVYQREALHALYSTDKKHVEYIDDADVHLIGTWKTPLEGQGPGREVEYRVFFGETELVIQTRQIGTEDWVQHSFNFLSSKDELDPPK